MSAVDYSDHTDGGPPPIIGTAMSDKQYAMASIDGRLCVFSFPDGHEIEGYIGGMDAENVKVIDSDVTVRLVNRRLPRAVRVATDSTLASEPSFDAMSRVIRPFQTAMRSRYSKR